MSTSNTSSTTISTTANYCGDQYNNKGCACMPQVTAGLTPATESAANTALICAYQENGIQYGCDTGCCPGGTCTGSPGTSSAVSNVASTSDTTSGGATSTTKEPNGSLYWAMVVLSIMYALFLVLGVGFASTRR
jgi:hypothetical protein